MVAYIRNLAVNKKGWLSAESFEDGVALCQSIPGATAMQAAAYVGLRSRGPLGALAAFVGFGLPAFVLMLILSAMYQESRDLPLVASAFRGLHVIVVALVANAAISFGRSSMKNWRDAMLAAGAAAVLMLHGSPIIAIAAAAVMALPLYRGIALPDGKGHEATNGGRRALGFAAFLAAGITAAAAVLFFLNGTLFTLAVLMMKIDVFAFGGGFASVPLMLHEVVDVRQWLDSKTFMDGIAMGQVTPGPIVITATFVGYQMAGPLGATVGTVGIFAPSLLMVLVTVPYFDRLRHWPLFRRAVRGVLAAFLGLLAAVAASFAIAIPWSIPAVILAGAAFAALRLKVDILWVVLVGAGVSILFL